MLKVRDTDAVKYRVHCAGKDVLEGPEILFFKQFEGDWKLVAKAHIASLELLKSHGLQELVNKGLVVPE